VIRYYCDGCGEEITAKNECAGAGVNTHTERLGTTIVTKRGKVLLGIEVLTSADKTWNSGNWCKYCVLDALYMLDDRVPSQPRQIRVVNK